MPQIKTSLIQNWHPAYARSALTAPAIILLILAGFVVRQADYRQVRYLGHAQFVLSARPLAMHGWPGFYNAKMLVTVVEEALFRG